MKYIIATLGCKVNQYESEAMEQLLQSHGHTPCAEGESADAVIVNTCAVTAEAGRKSRQAIHRLREENPGAVAAVLGCYSQLSPDAVQKLGADIVYGTADRLKLIDAVEKAVATGEGEKALDKPFERRVFEELPAGAVSGHTRALLKIQDGCVNFCSYCIIPYTRGRVRSLPMEAAVRQAAELDKKGYRELVITGIEIASYGRDLPGELTLADAVETVAAAAPQMRLRLGSLEPTVITEDFCRRAAALPHLCPHFHLSLQSGCDATLKRMNRKYDTARFRESVRLLNRYFHRPAITTDLICGFPEETEEEFGQTLAFIEECGFAAMHIFPYSIRPGTKAAAMEQVPPTVKEQRTARAGQVAERMHRAYLEGCVGQVYPVLFEQARDGLYTGHAPNYMEVGVAADGLHNVILDVKITGIDGEMLRGELT